MNARPLGTALICAVLYLLGSTAGAQIPAPKPTTAKATEPTVRVEVTAARPASSSPGWLIPLISAAAGVGGAFIGGLFATKNARAAITQKTNELEIDAIDRRIGDFIAPYEQLSLENLKLSRELKRGRQDNFRTLPALLEPNWKQSLSTGDKALVDAIVDNGKALRQMILDHGGAVSIVIRPHLAAASMHFRMLALADAGGLENDPKRYETYVYPRELDGALALERERLEARREKLRSRPAENHGPIDDLKLPQNLEIAPQIPTQAAEDASLL